MRAVNETTFVMHVTNSPEESVEDGESSGVSAANPTPPAPPAHVSAAAGNSRDADSFSTYFQRQSGGIRGPSKKDFVNGFGEIPLLARAACQLQHISLFTSVACFNGIDRQHSSLSRSKSKNVCSPRSIRTPLVAVNGTCGQNGRAPPPAPGSGAAAITCASPVCPHRRGGGHRSSSGKNGFHSQGSQTESRKKPEVGVQNPSSRSHEKGSSFQTAGWQPPASELLNEEGKGRYRMDYQ